MDGEKTNISLNQMCIEEIATETNPQVDTSQLPLPCPLHGFSSTSVTEKMDARPIDSNLQKPIKPKIKIQRKRREMDHLTGLVMSTKKMRLMDEVEGNKFLSRNKQRSVESMEEHEPNRCITFGDDFEEMLAFDDEGDDDDECEYESDSNDENYYKNDYPDDDVFDDNVALENECTSEEDDFGLLATYALKY